MDLRKCRKITNLNPFSTKQVQKVQEVAEPLKNLHGNPFVMVTQQFQFYTHFKWGRASSEYKVNLHLVS